MATVPLGIIAPHPPIIVESVGGSRRMAARSTIEALGNAATELAAYAPDAVVVISPHAPALGDRYLIDDSESLHGSLATFGDPVVREWAGDPTLARAIISELDRAGVPVAARSTDTRFAPGALDHGVLVPLSLLDPTQRLHVVTISVALSSYSLHRSIGEAVSRAAAASAKRVAFIASGDLSHRLAPDAPAGYSPRAKDLDEAIVGIVERGRMGELSNISPSLIDLGGECGLRSLIALGGFLGEDPVESRVLAYEAPWGVGYLTAVLRGGNGAPFAAGPALPDAAEDAPESQIVALARDAIRRHVTGDPSLEAPALTDPEYPAAAGAFVSLHSRGQLRGCIGTVLPTAGSLAEEVAYNAVQAATRDPRFPPVREAELDDLEVKVDVLRAPENCSVDDLDPEQYGVIVSSGGRRGLLLPDLEGVDDVRSQIEIAMRKAGIGPDDPCTYQRFRVDRYT